MDINAYLADLEYLVNIDSGSENAEGVACIASFFSKGFKELGWIVDVHDLSPACGPCVICRNREAEHYDMLLIGHMDTVFLAGTCAERPFRTDGEFAYGPGVADMKSGCLLMYYLMKDLPAAINEKLNIVVVFNPDEEISSRYSSPLYIPYARKSEFAFVYEGRGVEGDFCAKRKGAIGLKAEFFGKAGHCGYAFTNGGRSAVSEMARWIVGLDALQSRERNTTVNVGVANGGTKTNIIADYAVINASIRFDDPDESKRVKAVLEELKCSAAEHEIEVKLSLTGKQPLVLTEKGKAYVQHLEELAKQNGINAWFKARGGLSDANIIAQYGPVCIDGMGPAGTKCHSDEEYLVLSSIEEGYRFSMMVFEDLVKK